MQFAQLKPGPSFSLLHSLFYYAQRLVIARRLRRLIVAGVCLAIQSRTKGVPISQPVAERSLGYLSELQTSGLVRLGIQLDAQQLADIHHFLSGKPLHEISPLKRAFTLDQVPQGVRMADYALADILNCPHIVELANSSALLSLAAKYIGCKPTLSAISLRWSFPMESAGEGLQAFHRDSDDWRFLKVFVYLTDVEDDCGPHIYVQGTHRTRAPWRLRPYSDAEVIANYGDERCKAVTGPAGFAFAADTYGIHKGAVPKARRRLLLQFQYSILPVYMYRYQPLPYQQAQAFDTYVNRLIFR